MIIGQDRAVEEFATAWESRKLHHAWLLAALVQPLLGGRQVGQAGGVGAAVVLVQVEGPAVHRREVAVVAAGGAGGPGR